MKASFLIPASLASLVLAQAATPPSVYILMPSNPALTAVSSALNTLGYRYAEATAYGTELGLGLDPSTFAVLEPGTAYKNISRENPGARFILPASKADNSYSSWLRLFSKTQDRRQMGDRDARPDSVDAIRAFFAEMEEGSAGNGASQLLELDVFAHGSHEQAQSWVALCDFLGLGYSVVERLKLWHFPQ
ncbi:hypothetical protein GGR51DRAFT_379693 [Nemania sp. FL0031]|nr:hypothetical protein GGR51DRAFT_379693 [Nemania sp. FL0031]